jgi:polyhydroxybutyrate depolymerase
MSGGCQASRPERGTLRTGTCRQRTSLHHFLSARDYLVHVPQGYDEDRTYPLVVVLHGAFSSASQIESWSNFSRLADREGFVVAYPNGTGFFGLGRLWNARHCCGLASLSRVPDVEFISRMIGDLSARLRIDPDRVYVIGHSNGGMLAYYFASMRPDMVAAIGVVSGSIGSSPVAGGSVLAIRPPATRVPLIALHGLEDPTVPFEGGKPDFFLPVPFYVPVLDSVCSWAESCGCDFMPALDESTSAQEVLDWTDDDGRTWVTLHILNGWGHAWPGTIFVARLPPSHPLREFEACEVLWEFLRRHSRAEN